MHANAVQDGLIEGENEGVGMVCAANHAYPPILPRLGASPKTDFECTQQYSIAPNSTILVYNRLLLSARS